MNIEILKRAFVIGIIGTILEGAVVSWATQREQTLSKPGDRLQGNAETMDEARGKITGINLQQRTLDVKDAIVAKNFYLPPEVTIVTKDKRKANLKDLKVGDEATVSYRTEAEKLVATQIEIEELKDSTAPVPRSVS